MKLYPILLLILLSVTLSFLFYGPLVNLYMTTSHVEALGAIGFIVYWPLLVAILAGVIYLILRLIPLFHNSNNILITIALVLIVFALFVLKQRLSHASATKYGAPLLSELVATYKSSAGLKVLESSKYKFSLQYPDQWKYYPNRETIDSHFELFPEFQGSYVEVDVQKMSAYGDQKFNIEPLGYAGVFDKKGYTVSEYPTSGLKAKAFSGRASVEYLTSNNLHGDYKVDVVQYRGNDFFYIITAVYFVNSDTQAFTADFNALVHSLTVTK